MATLVLTQPQLREILDGRVPWIPAYADDPQHSGRRGGRLRTQAVR